MSHDPDPSQPLSQLETVELLRHAEAGNAAAFDVLYRRHFQRVLRVARARIGPTLRRRLDSIDLVQSVFREALEHAGQVQHASEGRFRHWLGAIVLNKIRNLHTFHHAERRDIDREDALGESGTAPPGGGLASSAIAERKEQWERMIAGLDQLEEREREVILLKRFEGMSWDEVAEQLGMPLRTAQDLEVRAKAKLVRIVGDG